MIGSPAVAAFIAGWAFWILLLVGRLRDDIGLTGTVVYLLLWLGGRFGLALLSDGPASALFSSWVALLDIALVLQIFKGDVRLR